MRIASRYVLRHALAGMGLVGFMLMGLELFILMLGELHSIGHGRFGLWQAVLYTLMQLPYQCYLMLPVIVLVGTLMGLGQLVNHQELLILRASGLHWTQICRRSLGWLAVMIFILFTLAELTLPPLLRLSGSWKTGLHSDQTTPTITTTSTGSWFRFQRAFIHIGHFIGPGKLAEVEEYRFDAQHHLTRVRRIERLDFQGGKWQMHRVAETLLPASDTPQHASEQTHVSHYRQGTWDLNLPPDLLHWDGQNPAQLSLSQLHQAAQQNQQAKLDGSSYAVTFWRRLFLPITSWVMLFVALPFMFNGTKEVALSHRLLLGTLVGFLFHIFNGIALPMSQFYRIPPWVAAALPLLVLLGVVLYWRLLRYRQVS